MAAPSSYSSWMAEIRRRATARAAEDATYDRARAGEQTRRDRWSAYGAGAAGRKKVYETSWAKNDRAAWAANEKDRRAIAIGRIREPYDSNFYTGRGENSGTAAALAAADRARYRRDMQNPYTDREYVAGNMPTFKDAVNPHGVTAPVVRGVRQAPVPYAHVEGRSRGLGVDRTARYGANFLDPYGRDILGMRAGMTPLQRMMNFTDTNYGSGDLQYGTQAARDYFARSLSQYMGDQRRSGGDYAGFNESLDLKKMAKDRLGLTYTNMDDLEASLNKNYGYVNQAHR